MKDLITRAMTKDGLVNAVAISSTGIVERAQAARDALGEDGDFALDFHGRFSPAMSRRVLPLLEPLLPIFGKMQGGGPVGGQRLGHLFASKGGVITNQYIQRHSPVRYPVNNSDTSIWNQTADSS